jgi:hypothetical protein
MAIASAGLAGCALPLFLLTSYIALQHPGGVKTPFFWMVTAGTGLMGLTGTVLGWIAVSSLRQARGALKGVPFAVFGALTFPVMALALPMVVLPAMVGFRMSLTSSPLSQAIGGLGLWVVPAGMITFALWATHALTRWTSGAAPARRRGVLKWVFIGLLASGMAGAFRNHHRAARAEAALERARAAADREAAGAPDLPASPTPLTVQITTTFVELLMEKGERWIVVHYTETKSDDIETAFRWHSTIPGFTPSVRHQSMALEAGGRPLHPRRLDFRLPNDLSVEQAEETRRHVQQLLTGRAVEAGLETPVPFVRISIPGAGDIAAELFAIRKPAAP